MLIRFAVARPPTPFRAALFRCLSHFLINILLPHLRFSLSALLLFFLRHQDEVFLPRSTTRTCTHTCAAEGPAGRVGGVPVGRCELHAAVKKKAATARWLQTIPCIFKVYLFICPVCFLTFLEPRWVGRGSFSSGRGQGRSSKLNMVSSNRNRPHPPTPANRSHRHQP